MKAYIAIKYYADLKNKSLIEEISYALETNGFTTSCIIRDQEKWGKRSLNPEELMDISFEKIVSSDLIVVDLSEKGVGLGIESGYAFAEGIPIITIAQEGSDISETLKGISKEVFLYENTNELIEFFSTVKPE